MSGVTISLEQQDLIWCLRRLPLRVRNLLKNNPLQLAVGGGFIRSCVANERVNDIDLFICKEIAADNVKAAALSYAVEMANGKAKVITTDNAVTAATRPFATQIITRWTFKSPVEVIESFDFTISKAIIYNSGEAHNDGWVGFADSCFYSDLAAKRLVYTQPERNEDAGGSILRVLKFYQRGYRIPLDSMGAVVARLMMGVKMDKVTAGDGRINEPQLAKILTGLLREVDPNIDPLHIAHLPSTEETLDTPERTTS